MGDSAIAKVDRATKHIDDLSDLLRKECPFLCILETDHEACRRSICTRGDEAVLERAGVICGDVLHNLRSALDHAYFEIVDPFVTDEKARKDIQFPFCETEARLKVSVKNRLADKVSAAFFSALIDLAPHGEPGGNEDLYLVHKLNLIDKHRLLAPVGDYTEVSAELIRAQVPDFPSVLRGQLGFGQNGRDFVWRIPADVILRFPPFDKKLDVPVGIVFDIGGPGFPRRIVPTLYRIANTTRETISALRDAAVG